MTCKNELDAAMVIRDLMSAMLALSELPADLIRIEANDIELVYIRLGQMLSHIREEHIYHG